MSSLLCIPLRYFPKGKCAKGSERIIQFDREKTVQDLRNRIAEHSGLKQNDFSIFLDLRVEIWDKGELVEIKGSEFVPILDNSLTLNKVGFNNHENFCVFVQIQ